MKAKIIEYIPKDNQGTLSTDDNKTYTFTLAQWQEQSLPNAGDEVDVTIDNAGKVKAVSYGLLYRNYASTVPQSNPIVDNATAETVVAPEWAIEEKYNFFDWFKKCLRNYANFEGRARRKEYWYFHLVAFALYLLTIIIDSELGGTGFIFGITFLGLTIPSLAVSVRRLHDVNRSGWWYLISMLPILSLLLIAWFLKDTYPVTNAWGKPARKVD